MHMADIKIIILDRKRTNKSFIGDTLGNIKRKSIKTGSELFLEGKTGSIP